MQEQRTRLSPAEKIARAREAYEAFSQGDLQKVAESWTEGITWHLRGSTRYGGDHHGRDAIFQLLSQLPQDFDEFKLEIHDILANDQHVVALLNQTAVRHGETYSGPVVHVHHVDDEGMIDETWFVTDTEQLKWALER
jgi:ketosteroid isomerase-like protein